MRYSSPRHNYVPRMVCPLLSLMLHRCNESFIGEFSGLVVSYWADCLITVVKISLRAGMGWYDDPPATAERMAYRKVQQGPAASLRRQYAHDGLHLATSDLALPKWSSINPSKPLCVDLHALCKFANHRLRR